MNTQEKMLYVVALLSIEIGVNFGKALGKGKYHLKCGGTRCGAEMPMSHGLEVAGWTRQYLSSVLSHFPRTVLDATDIIQCNGETRREKVVSDECRLCSEPSPVIQYTYVLPCLEGARHDLGVAAVSFGASSDRGIEACWFKCVFRCSNAACTLPCALSSKVSRLALQNVS